MVERIANYTILERVGMDGIGAVYRARDTRVGRTVQLRLLARTAPEDVAAFVHDARAAAALSHPGIAILYDVGDADGQPFIASEFVKGQTLRAAVGGHPLHPRRAVDVAAQIADALAEIDVAGIGYDTLTLDSVMVTTRGTIKLLDVGIARWSGLGASVGSSDAGGASNALAISSPGSNLRALGRVLFEMLTGKPASMLDDGPSTRAERMLPESCRALVMRLTRDKRGAPRASAVTVAAELRQLAAALDAKSADAQPTVGMPAPQASGSPARVLAGLLVLVAMGALLWFATR